VAGRSLAVRSVAAACCVVVGDWRVCVYVCVCVCVLCGILFVSCIGCVAVGLCVGGCVAVSVKTAVRVCAAVGG